MIVANLMVAIVMIHGINANAVNPLYALPGDPNGLQYVSPVYKLAFVRGDKSVIPLQVLDHLEKVGIDNVRTHLVTFGFNPTMEERKSLEGITREDIQSFLADPSSLNDTAKQQLLSAQNVNVLSWLTGSPTYSLKSLTDSSQQLDKAVIYKMPKLHNGPKIEASPTANKNPMPTGNKPTDRPIANPVTIKTTIKPLTKGTTKATIGTTKKTPPKTTKKNQIQTTKKPVTTTKKQVTTTKKQLPKTTMKANIPPNTKPKAKATLVNNNEIDDGQVPDTTPTETTESSNDQSNSEDYTAPVDAEAVEYVPDYQTNSDDISQIPVQESIAGDTDDTFRAKRSVEQDPIFLQGAQVRALPQQSVDEQNADNGNPIAPSDSNPDLFNSNDDQQQDTNQQPDAYPLSIDSASSASQPSLLDCSITFARLMGSPDAIANWYVQCAKTFQLVAMIQDFDSNGVVQDSNPPASDNQTPDSTNNQDAGENNANNQNAENPSPTNDQDADNTEAPE